MVLLPKWAGSGGYVRIDRPEGPPVERDTMQCGHCMKHWLVEPGSGRQRGWCIRCSQPLCGAPACMAQCVPFEAKIQGAVPW